MNRVILTGNLAKDPEIRTTKADVMCATFDLAVQRRYRDKDTGKREADFIRCIAFKHNAKYINDYCAKGHRLAVEGSIQVRSWEDGNGQKRYTTEVICDNVESLQGRSEGHGNAGGQADAPRPADVFPAEFIEVKDDELPF